LPAAIIAWSAQLVSHEDIVDALAGSECLQAVAAEVVFARLWGAADVEQYLDPVLHKQPGKVEVRPVVGADGKDFH